MNCLVNYFLDKFKTEGYQSIAFTNFGRTPDNEIIWNYEDALKNNVLFSKMVMFGCKSRFNPCINYYLSSSRQMHGDALKFQYNFQKFGTFSIDIDELKNSDSQPLDDFLNSVFLQALHISQKHSIYFCGETFIKRGSAYEHIIEADLAGDVVL